MTKERMRIPALSNAISSNYLGMIARTELENNGFLVSASTNSIPFSRIFDVEMQTGAMTRV